MKKGKVSQKEAQKVLDALVNKSGNEDINLLNPGTVKVRLKIGSLPGSSLIMCKISSESKEKLDNPQNPRKKVMINPEKEALSKSHFIMSGKTRKFFFPTSGIYKAMLNLPQQVYDGQANVSKKMMKSIKISGDFSADAMEIKSSKVNVRKDVAITRMRSAVVTHRMEFHNWSSEFDVIFDKDVINLNQITYLINQAGFYCGIGAWAPHCDGGGSHGMYIVPKQALNPIPVTYGTK